MKQKYEIWVKVRMRRQKNIPVLKFVSGNWGESEVFICISLKKESFSNVNILKWFGYCLGDWEKKL